MYDERNMNISFRKMKCVCDEKLYSEGQRTVWTCFAWKVKNDGFVIFKDIIWTRGSKSKGRSCFKSVSGQNQFCFCN